MKSDPITHTHTQRVNGFMDEFGYFKCLQYLHEAGVHMHFKLICTWFILNAKKKKHLRDNMIHNLLLVYSEKKLLLSKIVNLVLQQNEIKFQVSPPIDHANALFISVRAWEQPKSKCLCKQSVIIN
jgi:hypothetical protein